jgi:TusA-related sulfurtransferase
MKIARLMCVVLVSLTIHAQDTMQCPQHQESPDQHAAGVDMRGDHAMGFSHENTKHHFEELPDGGIIEVDANSESDMATRDQIREHLKHIAGMFSANDFEVPMFIHDTIPPGVPVMKLKSGEIAYTYLPTQRGAMVRIVTHDPAALKAVHEFLAFQIEDHRTGDPVGK